MVVGKIGFEDRLCASRKSGAVGGGGFRHRVRYTWWLSRLAIEKPWSVLGGPILFFLNKPAQKTFLSPVEAPFLTL